MSMEGKNFFSKNWTEGDLESSGGITEELSLERQSFFWKEIFNLGLNDLNDTEQIIKLKMILDELEMIGKNVEENTDNQKDSNLPTLHKIIEDIALKYGKQNSIKAIKEHIDFLEKENNINSKHDEGDSNIPWRN